MKLKHAELERAAAIARERLISELGPEGHWVGRLSSSALSTATAVCALQVLLNTGKAAHSVRAGPRHEDLPLTQTSRDGPEPSEQVSPTSTDPSLISRGLSWLAAHQNPDGGWGDTILSFSNISTSALCWAAFGADQQYAATVQKAEAYLTHKAGGIDPERLSAAIIKRYGKDRTFSVPILTMCAIAGRLGKGREAWRHVIPLPFEIAALPHKLFAILRMPVVSYALPALIAIGQARHVQAPSRNPLARGIRSLVRKKTLRVLESIQPASGGFLEATPLTSFVCMSLGVSGQANSPVAQSCGRFLRASVLPDGSWPIDTNLATWVTTLSVQALGKTGLSQLSPEQRAKLLRWLVDQQYGAIHPYTQAAPGGWAWTDLTGGVPDADDTSSALIALAELDSESEENRQAAAAGIGWLLGLQNSDGGIPTFCRGWTHLPFDQSSPDITAHALRAWAIWNTKLSPSLQKRLEQSQQRAVEYLLKAQQPDGSWIPLWFGNQHEPEEENRTYGTCKVIQGLTTLAESSSDQISDAIQRGISYLLKTQTPSGGWSGGFSNNPSTEETALIVETLSKLRALLPTAEKALESGLDWLIQRVQSGEWTQPAPIGFYFAKLWYYEKLYPIIFAAGALEAARSWDDLQT